MTDEAHGETTVRAAGNEWRLPVLVISPHLDDAVLSTGNVLQRLPDCVVLTVLAGNPAAWDRATLWDKSCGFGDGDDVVARRLEENSAALALLGTQGTELSFLDSQYSQVPLDAKELGAAIANEIRWARALSVVAPLGIGHDDHRLVAAASEHARQECDTDWYVYGDLPYLYEPGGDRQALDVRDRLIGQGLRLSLLQGSAAFPPKREAIDLYASQCKGLGKQRVRAALGREQYWRVTPPES